MHRLGVAPIYSYAVGDLSCHDKSTGHVSEMSMTCHGGGFQWWIYEYMNAYLELDVPPVALSKAKFRLLCTGFSLAVLWSFGGPMEYCVLQLVSDIEVNAGMCQPCAGRSLLKLAHTT